MAILLKKLTLFGITIFLAALLLDLCVTSGLRRTQRGDWGTWNAVFLGECDADLLISGNSRSTEHIDPAILDAELGMRSCNLAMTARGFETQYHAFGIYSLFNKRPRIILQNIDEWEFTRGQEKISKIQLFAYIDNPKLWQYLYHINFDRYDLYLPFVRYLGTPRHIVGGLLEFSGLHHFPSDGLRGYEPVDRDWDKNDLIRFKQKIDNLVQGRDPRTMEMFENFIKSCRDQGTTVILIYSPIYKESAEHIKDMAGLLKFSEELRRKYKVHILNYTDDALCNDTAYFYDSMHLNKRGSQIFTKKLAQDIKKLRILGRTVENR